MALGGFVTRRSSRLVWLASAANLGQLTSSEFWSSCMTTGRLPGSDDAICRTALNRSSLIRASLLSHRGSAVWLRRIDCQSRKSLIRAFLHWLAVSDAVLLSPRLLSSGTRHAMSTATRVSSAQRGAGRRSLSAVVGRGFASAPSAGPAGAGRRAAKSLLARGRHLHFACAAPAFAPGSTTGCEALCGSSISARSSDLRSIAPAPVRRIGREWPGHARPRTNASASCS